MCSTIDETYRLVKKRVKFKLKKPSKTARMPRARARSEPHVGNRYGRSEAARQAVLEAADNLLVEIGFAAITVEGIAARAGVGKQTIYRWWKSKTDVLLDAFLEDAAQHLNPPDTGNLQADLCAHLHQCARFFERSDAGAVFRALIGEAQHDAALTKQLRSKYLDQQQARDRLPLVRAVERGAVRADLDVDSVMDALMAPIHYRILVTGQPVTRPFTDNLVRHALAQIGVSSS
jgi:AcrR family transcriptional regulator